MSLEKNSIHEGIITGYESGGMGVCRLDGQVVFVERGVRGDRCRLRIVKALKNKAYARIEELLEPSPHRQEPCCPAFPKCGGCDFWHMQYEEELFAKRQRVQDALERLGGQSVPELEIVGGENFHYRNKAMYPCATEEGRPVAGFYRRRSHQVIPQENCAIQSPLADQLKEGVLRWAETCGVSIYEEETGRGLLRHIYVRTGKQGALLTLVVTSWKVPQPEKLIALCRESCPSLVGIVLNKNTWQTNRLLGEECRTLWGEGRLQDSLCGVEFSLSPLSFYQVNQPQAQRLYEQAVEYAAFSGMLSKLESRKECMEQIELIQHWNYFCSLAERLDDTKHYIDHGLQEHDGIRELVHGKVYSDIFKQIIVLAASEFEIMSKALCSAKGVKTKRIGDISETILGVFPKIIDFEVSTPFWINTPLHDWKTTRIDNGKNVKVEGLDWWFAYNSIKHDEKESIKNATFENAVLALASLYIIEIYLMKELFGNMSIIYTYPTVYFKCKYLPHSVSSGEGLLPDEGGLSPTERYKKECPELFKKYEIESK